MPRRRLISIRYSVTCGSFMVPPTRLTMTKGRRINRRPFVIVDSGSYTAGFGLLPSASDVRCTIMGSAKNVATFSDGSSARASRR